MATALPKSSSETALLATRRAVCFHVLSTRSKMKTAPMSRVVPLSAPLPLTQGAAVVADGDATAEQVILAGVARGLQPDFSLGNPRSLRDRRRVATTETGLQAG
jgi:hypothetical protein